MVVLCLSGPVFWNAPGFQCPNFSSPAHMNGEGSGGVIEICCDLAVQSIGIGSQFVG